MNLHEYIDPLRDLKEDWDGEGAEPPSRGAIDDTATILHWCLVNGLSVESVDPDVMGGTGIYLNGVHGTSAWIAVMNSGHTIITLRQNKKSYKCAGLRQMEFFLKETRA